MKLNSHKRSAALISGAAGLSLLVAGCGGTSSSSSSASAPAAKGVTINVAFAFPSPSSAALAEFTKETGITVKWTNVDWDSLQTKITVAAQAKTYFADVSDVDWSRVGQLGKLGWFLPMEKYLDTKSMIADMPQLSSFTYDGHVVGLPFDSSFMVTTINKPMFDKAGITVMPTTISEYTKDLQLIKSKGITQYPLNIGFAASEELSTSWYQATGAFGGTILDKSGKPQFATPDSAGYKAAVWMIEQLKSGLIPPGNINVKNSESQSTLMAKGTVASTYADYSGNVGSLYNVPSASTVLNQIQYMPTAGANGVGPNLANPDGIGVPAEAKHPAEAAKFIEWLTSSKNQADFSGANGPDKTILGYNMPSRLSAANEMAVKGKMVGGDVLIGMLKNSKAVFPEGAPVWYPQFSGAVNVNLHAAAIGSMTVPAAIKAIAAVAVSLSNGS
jgi:ABC-type glycerol-3-phosphate transport system substrate-binding protein